MTKREAIKRKADWAKALAEGRVVRWNDGMVLTSYPTVAGALAAVAKINSDLDRAGDAKIVVVQA